MASASLGNGGVGSSRSVNGFKTSSSSSVDWLGRGMLEMRLRDNVDHDDDRVTVLLNTALVYYCSFLLVYKYLILAFIYILHSL